MSGVASVINTHLGTGHLDPEDEAQYSDDEPLESETSASLPNRLHLSVFLQPCPKDIEDVVWVVSNTKWPYLAIAINKILVHPKSKNSLRRRPAEKVRVTFSWSATI
jgi:hypothetical protein